MWITSKDFWIDTTERCIGTMAEVAIPLFTVAGEVPMDWGHIATVVIGSGLVCLLKCIVKAQTGGDDDDSKRCEEKAA